MKVIHAAGIAVLVACSWAVPLRAADTTGTAGAAPVGDALRGRAIYDTGRLADGSALPAERPGVGPLPPAAAACVSCHRPSMAGGVEGGLRVPPIGGDVLFTPGQRPAASQRLQRQWLRHQQRSAYTPALLARALTLGLDPDGQPLAAAMPRYTLDAQALADIEAWLRGGGPTSHALLGLHDDALHLATVVTPQADARRREAVMQAMQAWSRDMAFGRTRVRWQLWQLQGEAAQWPAQLQALQRAHPVYALLSGAGGSAWEPVQDFCEAQGLPCLFPTIDSVPGSPPAWSFYLSGGVQAEARMLAQPLRSLQPASVLQLHAGPAGAAAAQLLAEVLASETALHLRSEPWVAKAAAPEADVVVLWLAPAEVQAWLAAQGTRAKPRKVLLSAQLAPPPATPIPPAWRAHVAWVSQHADPGYQAAGAALSLVPWSSRLQLPPGLDEVALADVHAATFFFADAVARMQGSWQPQLLLERLEAAVDRRPAGAGYFRLSLGPGQRVAAQGGHLLAFRPPALVELAPLPGYLRAAD